MTSAQELIDLKETIQGDREQQIKAEGRLEAHLTDLKKLGYASSVKAEAALTKLRKTIEKAQLSFEKAVTTFRTDYEFD